MRFSKVLSRNVIDENKVLFTGQFLMCSCKKRSRRLTMGLNLLQMRYPSKKDLSIVLVIVAAGLAGVGFYCLFILGIDNHLTWLVMGIATLYGAIIWALAYPVYYEITAFHLLIRSGCLKFQIPLSTIEMVRPTRNPLSAPAWSLDRLRIDYKRNNKPRIALISPEDKSRFLRELTQREEIWSLKMVKRFEKASPNARADHESRANDA